jgi:hypothetical protein
VVQLANLISINENSKSSIGNSLMYAEKRKTNPSKIEMDPFRMMVFIRYKIKKVALLRATFFINFL